MKKIKITLLIVIFVIAAYIIVIILSDKKKDDDQLVIKRGSNEAGSDITETDLENENDTLPGDDLNNSDNSLDSKTLFLPENISTAGIIINGEEIPEYEDEPYVQVNYNAPFFTETEMNNTSFENLSELDEYGRCGVAIACIGTDIMPTEERSEIGDIKPSGWHMVKYEGVVNDGYLYNRCHLIDYQLTGENSDIRNFITGTEFLNIEGMLPFENMVARYVEMTGNHVMYRVTPIYKDDNLIAKGVLMEARSVEDDGMGVYFNVFVYNVQPGVEIDYSTGDSKLK